MKSTTRFFLIALLLVISGVSYSNASDFDALDSDEVMNCPGITNLLAQTCVGECGGMISTFNYQETGLCPPTVNYCVSVTDYSLCGNHRGSYSVRVNGVEIYASLIAGTSDYYSFSAPCSAQISVTVRVDPLNNGIVCKRLGDVEISLFN